VIALPSDDGLQGDVAESTLHLQLGLRDVGREELLPATLEEFVGELDALGRETLGRAGGSFPASDKARFVRERPT
jgi:hypothetical protein